MFGLAIWDDRTRELWLVRDRMGIKPLFYSTAGGKLAFGSEIKTILADPNQPRRIDAQAVYHYLSFLTAPAPLTFFADIKKLAAGSWLRAGEDGRIEERVWWDPWDHVDPIEGASDAELAARVLDELRTSVELRKMSDRPVGIFLSGGIDSSTNAALFAEGEARPVRTFSIGYDARLRVVPERAPDARRMAERIGADHHERIVSLDDLIAFLPELVRLQDEPIADPVSVPLYYVSRARTAERRRRRPGGRGCRRALLRLPVLADTSSPPARGRPARARVREARRARGARGGRPRPDPALRVPAPRRRGHPGVLGRRRGVHRDAEAAAARPGAA